MPTRRAPHRRFLSNADKIQVHVRIRPLQSHEGSLGLQYDGGTGSVQGLQFDKVHGPDTPQEEVFESLIPILDSWVDGYNGCIFAYGQTGSGKTHTMLGEDGGKKRLNGVIPQAVQYCLHRLEEELAAVAAVTDAESQFQLRASYIELYNEELRDLLGSSSNQVQVREDSKGTVFTEGAEWKVVETPEDVIRLIHEGSERRQTGRTNMNEHSSRSHAVFALRIEHRWRDEECIKSGNPRMFKSKTSLLNLVDLAGSEYAKKTGNTGDRMRESIAINSGLFALGNVIAALAGHRTRRVGDHIPYRDSILTRLLQSSLGGDSKTVMMACCGPAESNLAESMGTLQYAASTRAIENTAKLHVENVEQEAKPMDDDLADPDETLDRRCVFVETSFGEVFCRCLGDEQKPLILYVHGSGPTNSSTWYNPFIYELAARCPDQFFQVSIDCPGYGRSIGGDRQSIRSDPGVLLMEIIHGLGKSEAFCLVGSSQGCCSVFNATLEFPRITSYLAVMHPVGHDVFRYKALTQPCLLTFDVEDAGHPVKVGRWMKEQIPTNIYHEFYYSKQPFWLSDHFVPEMIRLFETYPLGTSKSSTRSGASGGIMPVNMFRSVRDSIARVAGGLINWAENKSWGEPSKEIEAGLLQPPSRFIRDEVVPEMLRHLTMSSDTASYYDDPIGLEWRAEVNPKDGRLYYTCDSTLEVVYKRPKNGKIVYSSTAQQQQSAVAGGATTTTTTAGGAATVVATSQQHKKKKTGGSLFDDEQKEEDHVETEDEKAARIELERKEISCYGCGFQLWKPRRMIECRHVICEACYHISNRYVDQCMVCRTKTKCELDAAHQELVAQLPGAKEREAECEEAKAQQERGVCYIIEYGNTADGQPGQAYNVEAFVKCVAVEKGKQCKVKSVPDKGRVLSRVDFNINPSYPKAAIKVQPPQPFKLQRCMALKFTCEMILHVAGLPTQVIVPYYMHHDSKTTRKLVICDVGALAGQRKPAPVKVFDYGWGDDEPEPPACGVVFV